MGAATHYSSVCYGIETAEHVNPFDRWTRGNAGEILPNVITPYTWSATWEKQEWRDMLRMGHFARMVDGIDFARLYCGRLYFNVGAIHRLMAEEMGLPSAQLYEALGGAQTSEALGLPERPFRLLRLMRHLPTWFAASRRQMGAPTRFEKLLPSLWRLTEELRDGVLADKSKPDLLADLKRGSDMTNRIIPELLAGAQAAFSAFGLVREFSKRWCGDGSLANDLVAGLSDVRTAEANIELWKIARLTAEEGGARKIVEETTSGLMLQALSSRPEGRETAERLEAFLSHYGHRCPEEMETAVPRWAEEPATLLALFAAYVRGREDVDPLTFADRQARRRREAEERARSLVSRRLIDRLVPYKRVVFGFFLRQARRYLPLRENPKFELLKLGLQLRRIDVELGRRFRDEGLLDAAEDFFFLTFDEVAELASAQTPAALRERVRSVVAARRREFEEYRALEAPEAIGPKGEVIEMPSLPAGGSVLAGMAASAGVASGPARVITSLSQAGEFQAGDILVAPFTDPGWTPLFPLARAIVTDLGGVLSHGAIVAREYGIPAVVNVRVATQRIQTGQPLTVDGSRGTVTIHSGTEAVSG